MAGTSTFRRYTVRRITSGSLRGAALLLVLALSASACGESAASPDVATEVAEELVGVRSDIIDMLRANDATSLATAFAGVDFSVVTTAPEITILAPNDQAFLGLTPDETAELLESPEDLTAMLRLHVIPERLDAAALATRSSVVTAAGTTLEVTEVDGQLRVGDASVVLPDAGGLADGAVHVIDTVLQP